MNGNREIRTSLSIFYSVNQELNTLAMYSKNITLVIPSYDFGTEFATFMEIIT